MTSCLRRLPIVVALLFSAVGVGSQDAPLTIIRADPSGELTAIDDADQIRIAFSEPMVAIGTVPDGRAPSWLQMTPTWPGAFYWAGTRTLVFSPDAATPLPYSTKFTVRIDTSATSIAGRRLAVPYELSFTTPTLRLIHAVAERKTDRFDSPVLIDLYFNQPIRDRDLLAHARVAMEPHEWPRPELSQNERTYWQQEDPAGLARFDRKVADVDRVTASSDRVDVKIAEQQSWGTRYDDSPGRVVLETIGIPPPESWLRIVIDEGMPGAEGQQPHPPLTKVVKLERALFLAHCIASQGGCAYNTTRRISQIQFSGSVRASVIADGLTVTDVTNSTTEREVAREGPAAAESTGGALTQLGFATQPAMSRWRLRVGDLQAADGQTLGYSWAALSEAGHDLAEYALGGSVFEAGSGSQLPFVARNVTSVRRWLLPVTPSSLIPALRLIRERSFPIPSLARMELSERPPGAGEEFLLRPMPDLVERHPFNVAGLLTNGTGLIWATAAEPKTIPGSSTAPGGGLFSAVVQVTNLGITLKHGPLSTLVFVTRLDNGLPVDDAAVTIRDALNHVLWTVRTGKDGIATAPALILPVGDDFRPQFIVTAEKDGDVAFVNPAWNNAGQGSNDSLRGSWNGTGRLLRGSLFTDRGVYRQGERIHMKAMLRHDTPQGMTLLPPGTRLELVLQGPRDEERRHDVTVNEWSSVEWQWAVPPDAALGRYHVSLSRAVDTYSEEIRGQFLVAAYKTPEFRVDATLTSDTGTLGSPIRGRIDARYLFGGPVGARAVNWHVRRVHTSGAPAPVRHAYPPEKYDVGYVPPSDVRSGSDDFRWESATLDASGSIGFTIPTPDGEDTSFQYMVETNVASASGEHIAGRTSLTVHPSSLFLAVARPPYFVATPGTSVTIAAVTPDGRAAAGVTVDVTLVRNDWISGGTSWTRVETPSGSWSVATSSSEVPLRLTFARTGSYTLRAVARDSAGRSTRTESHFYGLGPDRPYLAEERWQPDRAHSGTSDVEARRDGTRADPVTLGARHGAAHR